MSVRLGSQASVFDPAARRQYAAGMSQKPGPVTLRDVLSAPRQQERPGDPRVSVRMVGDGKYRVIKDGRRIGHLVRTIEPCGRPGWRVQTGRTCSPRIYRNRHVAAQALALAHDLTLRKCSLLELVLRAWDSRP